MKQPYYDNKFRQWCISYLPKGGGFAAVWGDTKDECILRYENIIKEQKNETDR